MKKTTKKGDNLAQPVPGILDNDFLSLVPEKCPGIINNMAGIGSDGTLLLPHEYFRNTLLGDLSPFRSISRVYETSSEDESVLQFRESHNLQFSVTSPTSASASIQVIDIVAGGAGIPTPAYLLAMAQAVKKSEGLVLTVPAYDETMDIKEQMKKRDECNLMGIGYKLIGQLEFTTELTGVTYGQISDRADLLMEELHEQTMFLLS